MCTTHVFFLRLVLKCHCSRTLNYCNKKASAQIAIGNQFHLSCCRFRCNLTVFVGLYGRNYGCWSSCIQANTILHTNWIFLFPILSGCTTQSTVCTKIIQTNKTDNSPQNCNICCWRSFGALFFVALPNKYLPQTSTFKVPNATECNGAFSPLAFRYPEVYTM